MVRKWLHYTGGALGLGLLSAWLFRHSQLAGSNDLNRWTKDGVDAATGFLEEHVQQPVGILLLHKTKCCDLEFIHEHSLG